MKLNAVHNDVEQSVPLRSATATIKATPKIFSFFADQTYANKPVAILRELVANGVDAHVMGGTPDRPVEVILPTELDPTFIVRDHGIGMSELFILGDDETPSKFMAYTDGSTKDGDNKAIGGFGIGSKAPLAYVDQFTLRVIHDGVLSVYTLFKNDIGIPEISLNAQTTTDEHNGVEISFPVHDDDIETFRAAAQTALQYFRPLPLVTNGTINPPDYSYVGKGWALRPDVGELGIIMGGVRYPVAKASLEYSLQTDDKVSKLLSYGIDLTMPIGSVSVALSREALSYDKEGSEAIRAALLGVFDDVKDTFSTLFDKEPTRWSAIQKLHKETGGHTNAYSQNPRQQLLAANAVYKGQKLEPYIDLTKLAGFKGWFIEPKRQWGRQKSINTAKWELPGDLRALYPGMIQAVIVDDLPITPKSKTGIKLRNWIEQSDRSQGTIILRLDTDNDKPKAYDDLIANLGNPEVILTSSLPEPVVAAKASKALGIRPKVRMFTFGGGKHQRGYSSYYPTNLTPGHGKPVKEIPYVDQPDRGIMVVMNAFDLPKDFEKQMKTGLVQYDELVFVNEGDKDKIKDNFENYLEVFARRLKTALAKHQGLSEKAAVADFDGFSSVFANFATLNQKGFGFYLSSKQTKTPFGKILDLYNKYVKSFTDEERLLARFVPAKAPKGVKMEDLAKAYEAEQGDVDLVLDFIADKLRWNTSNKANFQKLLHKVV